MVIVRPAIARDALTWPDIEPDRWREGGNRRSFVAEMNGEIVGHCRGIDNIYHPSSRVLVLEVKPHFRGRGVGTALLQAQIGVSELPLRAKITAKMPEAWALASKFGGVVEQACPPWQYTVGPDLREWAKAHRSGGAGFAIRPVAEDDLAALAILSVDHYIAQHAAWSPSASREVMQGLFKGDFTSESLNMNLTQVAVEGGRIIAAACVWSVESSEGMQSADPEITEISLIVDRHEDVEQIPAVAACLAGVIDASADGDVYGIDSHLTERVEYEFMRSVLGGGDPSGWVALVAIPVPGAPKPTPVPNELIPDEAAWMRRP